MIVRETIDNSLVRTYSDQSVYIHGGFPEGDYEVAVDPIDANRSYVETDIPIETIEEEPGDWSEKQYAQAGRILLGVET